MSRVPDTRSAVTDYRFKAGQMLVKYSPRALSPVCKWCGREDCLGPCPSEGDEL